MTVPPTSDLLQEALALHRRGALAEAAARYADVLRSDPGNADAHYYLAALSCQQGRFAEGIGHARQSLAADPQQARAHALLGRALTAIGRPDEALASFDRAIALAPELASAHGHRADLLGDLGRHAKAIESYDRALALAPDAATDWFNRGIALVAVGRHSDAVASFDHAIAAKPDFAEARLQRAKTLSDLQRDDDALKAIDEALAVTPDFAAGWLGRGHLLLKLKRREDAIASFDRAVALKPDLAEAWMSRADVLADLNRCDDALTAYRQALAVGPDFAAAWIGSGNQLFALRRYDDALTAYQQASALTPDLAAAWIGRGNVLTDLRRHGDALAAYDRAIGLQPQRGEAWVGRGNVLFDLARYGDAAAAYDRAIALNPGLAEAWLGRGNVLSEGARHDEAFAAYDRALTLNPNLNYAAGARLNAKLFVCDWKNLQADIARLRSDIRQNKPVSYPFTALAAASSPADQLQCARNYSQRRPAFSPIWHGEAYRHDRIRIAYLSADFREHPMPHLTAGMFERHDRSRFEVTAISIGPDEASPMRGRLKAAFEHFIDVNGGSDHDVAALVRRHEIDIAVDLMGYTANSRPDVLARRPAPVQVSYLGYPGTMGASHIDYIIADKTVIPPEAIEFYSEKVAWLPDSYYPNDDRRRISEHVPTRRECGLPERGLVFCCFNNSYKLTPELFDVWMRLLRATENGVLWLLGGNPAATANLQREAQTRGVPAERLVFAKRIGFADHLARHRHADLFLDTLPYNAHTTASDALWTDVPVLTCAGETFAGRVAASQLKALGLAELVTDSLGDYEALALRLAQDLEFLGSLKAKLSRNRLTQPLFDTERFTRHMEAAYHTMWQNCRDGCAPTSFAVNAGG